MIASVATTAPTQFLDVGGTRVIDFLDVQPHDTAPLA